MAENRKKTSGGGDWGWPLIILSFCFGLWPVGLVLLFGKLFADDEKKPVQKFEITHFRTHQRPTIALLLNSLAISQFLFTLKKRCKITN